MIPVHIRNQNPTKKTLQFSNWTILQNFVISCVDFLDLVWGTARSVAITRNIEELQIVKYHVMTEQWWNFHVAFCKISSNVSVKTDIKLGVAFLFPFSTLICYFSTPCRVSSIHNSVGSMASLVEAFWCLTLTDPCERSKMTLTVNIYIF